MPDGRMEWGNHNGTRVSGKVHYSGFYLQNYQLKPQQDSLHLNFDIKVKSVHNAELN